MKSDRETIKTGRKVCLPCIFVLLAVLMISACTSIGPKSINRDQLDYGQSIGQNWKNQMLANLVRLRFVDMPVYLDVGQIVAGYSLETQLSAGAGAGTAFDSGSTATLGASGKFTDRPTITYTPKTGNDYLTSLLTPIEPAGLLSLIQSGYDANLLFTWAVEAVNGLQNYSVAAGNKRSPDPEFYEFVGRLKELQLNGGIGFEQSTDPATKNDIIILFRNVSASDQVKETAKTAREVIGLDPDRTKFRVIYSPFATGDDALAIQTRSIMQIMIAMAGFIDVPAARASEAFEGYEVPPGAQAPFSVHSGPDKPEYSFASSFYNGYWYWIDPVDIRSKQVFTLMLFINTLTDNKSKEDNPVLTIPTG